MRKFLHIFLYEFLRHVRQKRFIFTLLSMPLLILIAAGIGQIAASVQYNPAPLGYVDLSGWLSEAPPIPSQQERTKHQLEIKSFDSEMEAGAALRDGEIQAYYVLQQDYLDSGRARLVSPDTPGEQLRGQFRDFIRYHLAAGMQDDAARRLLEGSDITVQSADGMRRTSEAQLWNILLPIFSGLLFIMAVNTGSGYLLQAVVEEKENRTIEILVSSVSSAQLMAGKIAGNISVGLVLLFSWGIFGWIGIFVIRRVIFPELIIQMESSVLLLMIFTLLPAFVLVAALMAAIGATVTEMREAQQVAGIFSLLVVMPFWFTSQLLMSPNSPFAVALSIFPLTAPVALPFRAISTAIPLWQLVLSLALLYGGAAFAIWLAGRAFRMGMLMYGQRLSFARLFTRGW